MSKPKSAWIIYSPKERLWWSNKLGWTKRLYATRFTKKETVFLNPPIGGKWVRR